MDITCYSEFRCLELFIIIQQPVVEHTTRDEYVFDKGHVPEKKGNFQDLSSKDWVSKQQFFTQYIHIYIYIYICVCVCMCVYMYVCVCVRVCVLGQGEV